MKRYVPITPAGTPCTWLAASTERQAIENLLEDAKHMPYGTWAGFVQRGYTIADTKQWTKYSACGKCGYLVCQCSTKTP